MGPRYLAYTCSSWMVTLRDTCWWIVIQCFNKFQIHGWNTVLVLLSGLLCMFIAKQGVSLSNVYSRIMTHKKMNFHSSNECCIHRHFQPYQISNWLCGCCCHPYMYMYIYIYILYIYHTELFIIHLFQSILSRETPYTFKETSPILT